MMLLRFIFSTRRVVWLSRGDGLGDVGMWEGEQKEVGNGRRGKGGK